MFIVSELKIISFGFFFLSFLLPLSPGTIAFTSCQILALAFFSSVACVNQTVASLEVFIMKDSVVLISDPHSCTSTSRKNLLTIFLYAPFVVPVQISAIVMLMTGQILMINIQKMVHKAVL